MYAAKKRNSDRISNIDELSIGDNTDLECHCCFAKVKYTRQHEKNASSKPIAAYLSLSPGVTHTEQCIYTLQGAINHLVANSENVEDVESIFERGKDGGYIFRMNIAVNALKTADKIQQPNSTQSLPSIDLSVGQDFIKTERQISSYLNSASGIAKIRSQMEDSDMDNLKNLLKIQYKDKYISWKDFYYENTRYHELFDKTIKGKEIEYPIAIVVTIKDELRTSATATKFTWSFNCHSEDKDSLSYAPTIYIANKKVISNLERNKSYLVVGKVWAKKPPYTNKYRNINIGVFFKSQIRTE